MCSREVIACCAPALLHAACSNAAQGLAMCVCSTGLLCTVLWCPKLTSAPATVHAAVGLTDCCTSCMTCTPQWLQPSGPAFWRQLSATLQLSCCSVQHSCGAQQHWSLAAVPVPASCGAHVPAAMRHPTICLAVLSRYLAHLAGMTYSKAVGGHHAVLRCPAVPLAREKPFCKRLRPQGPTLLPISETHLLETCSGTIHCPLPPGRLPLGPLAWCCPNCGNLPHNLCSQLRRPHLGHSEIPHWRSVQELSLDRPSVLGGEFLLPAQSPPRMLPRCLRYHS